MAPGIDAFGHPPTIPVSLRGECPSNCNRQTAPRLGAYTNSAMSTLIGAWWRAGLHQVFVCHCYLLETVNISVWEQLHTSVRRRRMLQEWEEAIVAWCPLLGVILQYGCLRTLLKCLQRSPDEYIFTLSSKRYSFFHQELVKVNKLKPWWQRRVQGSTGSGQPQCFTSGSQLIWLSLEKTW